MKTITLVACNRPGYTRVVLDSIRAAKPEGYKLFIRIDPSCPKTIDLCSEVDFMDAEIYVNRTVLGPDWNNRAAFDRVFELGSTCNVALEDDTPLCPDAFELIEWFWKLPRRDHYLLMNLFNENPTLTDPNAVQESDRFCPWGFCMTREQYLAAILPRWMCDTRGWDWSILTIIRKHGFKTLTPDLSRTRNIGRLNGTKYDTERHDRQFAHHPSSTGGYTGGFHLV